MCKNRWHFRPCSAAICTVRRSCSMQTQTRTATPRTRARVEEDESSTQLVFDKYYELLRAAGVDVDCPCPDRKRATESTERCRITRRLSVCISTSYHRRFPAGRREYAPRQKNRASPEPTGSRGSLTPPPPVDAACARVYPMSARRSTAIVTPVDTACRRVHPSEKQDGCIFCVFT